MDDSASESSELDVEDIASGTNVGNVPVRSRSEVDVGDSVGEFSELDVKDRMSGTTVSAARPPSEAVDVGGWADEFSELDVADRPSSEDVVVVDDSADGLSGRSFKGVDSGVTIEEVVEELSSEVTVKLAETLFTCADSVSTGNEEVIPVPDPVPEGFENKMPSGDCIVEGIETESWSGGGVLETPTVVPNASLEVSMVMVGVTIGVGTTIAEAFVKTLLSVIVEPLSSTMTVIGTMTTVVNGLSGTWRWRRGALSPNSRLTNRGK